MTDSQIIAITERWIDRVVVGLNLCPFARRELQHDRVRFAVTHVTSEDELLTALYEELELLQRNPSVETSLLIHPAVLRDFFAYNQFLERCDHLLRECRLEGVLQIASFHPDYQFAGTASDAAENYSNRSPYPMLHLLRESSVSAAVEGYPDVEAVPERNIATLNKLGARQLAALWQGCFDDER